MISGAKSMIKYRSVAEYITWVKARPEHHHYKSNIVKTIDMVDVKAPKAIAFISEGQWVADCPSGCGAAMWVEPELPYMCGYCFNIQLGGRWRLVQWPKTSEKAAIEIALEKRLMHVNRNWSPAETSADLETENIKHGIK